GGGLRRVDAAARPARHAPCSERCAGADGACGPGRLEFSRGRCLPAWRWSVRVELDVDVAQLNANVRHSGAATRAEEDDSAELAGENPLCSFGKCGVVERSLEGRREPRDLIILAVGRPDNGCCEMRVRPTL